MIQDGLLTSVGHTKAADGRKVSEYVATFNKAVFEIHKSRCGCQRKCTEQVSQNSFTYNSICELIQ